jgi:hypothetical protein
MVLKQTEELLQQKRLRTRPRRAGDDVAVRAPTEAAQFGVMRLVDNDWTKGRAPMTTVFTLPELLRRVLR